jgi:hypothetical protein
MAKSEQEINAEKAHKSRPDLLPASALMAAGRVMGYGLRKHGNCTWRVAGTEQADPRTHVASMIRHALAACEDPTAIDEESGLPHLACVITQAAIAFDCTVRLEVPPIEIPVTVTSAFAAGAIEGEDPWKLPSGWDWVTTGVDRWAAHGRILVDDFDSDETLADWSKECRIPLIELVAARELVRQRNGWAG